MSDKNKISSLRKFYIWTKNNTATSFLLIVIKLTFYYRDYYTSIIFFKTIPEPTRSNANLLVNWIINEIE